MVIEPFTYIKSTAFKERMEIANKVNEIVEIINSTTDTTNNFDSRITENENAIDEIETNLAGYNSRISANAIAIVGIETDLVNYNSRITANETAIDDIETNLAGYDSRITANATAINNKQDKLTAGSNITIVDNVISAAAGSGSSITTISTTINIGIGFSFNVESGKLYFVSSDKFSFNINTVLNSVSYRLIDYIQIADPDSVDGALIYTGLFAKITIDSVTATVTYVTKTTTETAYSNYGINTLTVKRVD